MKVLSGSAHETLARDVARASGVPLTRRSITRFPDGEVQVRLEEPVRGADVFLVQPLRGAVGDQLLEFRLLADACRRSGARRVIAVVPYLAYARQDRREAEGLALGARVIADVIGASADLAVVVDLHSPAVEGCFSIPVEHLSCMALLAGRVPSPPGNAVVVAPDLGAAKRAERFARRLGAPVAIVHKQRLTGRDVQAHGVVGDVEGRSPILVDDIISTGGTIEAAVRALLDAGATDDITVCAAHGLFVPPAPERLRGLPLKRILVSDSVPLTADLPLAPEVVSLAPLLSEAIARIHAGNTLPP